MRITTVQSTALARVVYDEAREVLQGAIKGAGQMGDPSVEVFTDSHPSSVLGEWTKASKSHK